MVMAPSASSSSTSTASAGPLHLIPTRRATYNKSRKGAQRRLNWPHPLASSLAKPSPSSIHPQHLAAAGFHSTPTLQHPTRSTCFLCHIIVEEWIEGDSPLQRHLELNHHCGWAILQTILHRWAQGLRDHKDWTAAWGQRAEWWPKSDYINQARLASFDKGWPHQGDERVPSKEEVCYLAIRDSTLLLLLTLTPSTTTTQIAAAGWFFAPGRDGDSDDQCICPFCTRTVEGWEQGDDPV